MGSCRGCRSWLMPARTWKTHSALWNSATFCNHAGAVHVAYNITLHQLLCVTTQLWSVVLVKAVSRLAHQGSAILSARILSHSYAELSGHGASRKLGGVQRNHQCLKVELTIARWSQKHTTDAPCAAHSIEELRNASSFWRFSSAILSSLDFSTFILICVTVRAKSWVA